MSTCVPVMSTYCDETSGITMPPMTNAIGQTQRGIFRGRPLPRNVPVRGSVEISGTFPSRPPGRTIKTTIRMTNVMISRAVSPKIWIPNASRMPRTNPPTTAPTRDPRPPSVAATNAVSPMSSPEEGFATPT